MNQSSNSHNFGSQRTYKNSNIGLSSNAMSDLQQEYEGAGLQFVPPQHKYIDLERYESPFFRDNNQEEYVIQRAFQANNFTYLRNLPDNFSRNCILDQREKKVKNQINQQANKRMRTPLQAQQARKTKIDQIKKAKIGSLGYFQVFPYKESDYQLPKKLAIKQRQENVQKRKDVCDKDFRPMGFDVKMKYEDPFRYIDRLDSTTKISESDHKYLFPFHLPQDVYDAFKQSQKRRKIVEKQLIIAGEFYPSQKQYSLNTVSKAKMPEILNQIEYYFKKFLKDKYGYFIGVNKRDYIEIMFEEKHIDDPRLQMALSGMLEHQILSKYVLRRNFDRWGTISEKTGHLQFVILPPWVKDPQQKLRLNTPATNTSQTRRV